MVNEPSVFEPLKIYCKMTDKREKNEGSGQSTDIIRSCSRDAKRIYDICVLVIKARNSAERIETPSCFVAL